MLSKPAIMKCEKSQHENKVPGLAAPIKSNKTKGLELDGTIKTFLGINKLSAMCAPRPMSPSDQKRTYWHVRTMSALPR